MFSKGHFYPLKLVPDRIYYVLLYRTKNKHVLREDIALNEAAQRVHCLKVHKREIVDLSDFHDFYAIKSLRVSDFGVKIKICLKNT
jgi:hypothetical protein